MEYAVAIRISTVYLMLLVASSLSKLIEKEEVSLGIKPKRLRPGRTSMKKDVENNRTERERTTERAR